MTHTGKLYWKLVGLAYRTFLLQVNCLSNVLNAEKVVKQGKSFEIT